MPKLKYCFILSLLVCLGLSLPAGAQCWRWKPLPITQAPNWSTIDLLHSFLAYDRNEQKLALLASRWDHYIELWYLDGDKFIKKSEFKYNSPYDPYGFYFDETLSSLVIITCDNCGFECQMVISYRYEKTAKTWERIAESESILPLGLTVAYDIIRKKTIIVGLVHPYSYPFYVFLEFDGAKFEINSTMDGLNMTTGGLMGYDRESMRIIYWGSASGYADETCEYDGNVWTLIRTSHDPGKSVDEYFHRAVFVPEFEGLVALYSDGLIFELWVYRKQDWRRISFISSPPPRCDGLLGYDESSGRLIFGGGWNDTGKVSDFWEMVPAGHCRPITKP